ncbi:MAG TPA: hypothetical protein VGH38_07070, partial [Bryobacteraceae bacterium]
SLTVGAVSVSPSAVTFAYQIGGTPPQSTSVTLSSATATTVNLSAATSTGGQWLSVSPTSGTAPGTAILSVNQGVVQNLAAGTYNGTVTVTPTSGASQTPVSVAVTLTVTPQPPVTISPAAATLGFQIGGTNNAAQQSVTLATTGSQAVPFGVSTGVDPNPSGRIWFTVSPSGGAIPANGNTSFTVAYDTTANLPASPCNAPAVLSAAGCTYKGTITLSTPSGTPSQQNIPVSLLVSTSPLLNVSPGALNFAYQVGTAAPASQNVTVSSTSGALATAISATTANGNSTWLKAPTGGTTGTPFAVSVDPTGLQPGTYTGTVNVSSAGAANGPLPVAVTLVVTNNPAISVSVNGCSNSVNGTCPMVFAAQIGQQGPATQNLRIASTTGSPLNFTITPAFGAAATACGGAWLLPNSTLSFSGTTDTTVPIFVNPGGIGAGSTCQANLSIAATVASTGAAVPNSPFLVPVTLYVSTGVQLVASQNAINFTAPIGGQTTPSSASITLTSTSSTDAVTYTVSPITVNWLFVSPQSGSTSGGSNVLTVIAVPGLFSPGTLSTSITITATGPGGAAVADSPITIPVTLTITAGTLTASPTSLTFNQPATGTPAAQTVTITSSGPSIPYSVTAQGVSGSTTWLSVTPSSGTASGASTGSFTVTADGSKLAPNTYTGTVTVTPNSGTPVSIPVTLNVPAGTISVTPTTLTFAQAVGGAAPTSQTLHVALTGTTGPIGITVAAAADNGGTWLSATPTTGNAPGTVTVTASAGSLAVGQYTGKVTITAAAPGASGSPLTIPVTLNVVNGQQLTGTPTTLNFTGAVGGTVPASQTITLSAPGAPIPFTAAATTATGGSWLQVSPASGNTPGTVTVSVSPQSLTAGQYTGTVTLTSPNSVSPVTVTVNLNMAVVPKPLVTSVNNAASYSTGAVSPGENIVIFGSGIGPAPPVTLGTVTSSGTFATTAGNTQVLFDGVPAPVIYASDTVTSVIVPYGIFGRQSTTIRVSYLGVLSDALTYNVGTSAPGIYTLNQSGTGPGAILNQDFSVNGPSKPAAKGSVLQVYMTGEGETDQVPGQDGAVAPVNGTGLFHPRLPVTATVGGVPATVQYAGSAPGIVYGVMQVNLLVPASVGSGPQPVVITVGSNATQTGVTAQVQ